MPLVLLPSRRWCLLILFPTNWSPNSIQCSVSSQPADDDVDKSLSDHMKKTEEEGPSLPSRYFCELYHTSVNVGSLWLLHNYGHSCDWSVMSLMPVSYCRLVTEKEV